MNFDLLIKRGTIIDGASREPYQADIGITGTEIKAIGDLRDTNATRVIPADNLFVTPGFIDIQNHSDSYFTLLDQPEQQSLTSQGITTIALGQCGTSLAPLTSPEALRSIQKWHFLAGTNLDWLSFGELLAGLEKHALGVNVTSLVGHATMRRGLVGDEVRSATVEEMKIMEKLLSESLAAGAAGLSLGLVYAHEVDSSRDELFSAARTVGATGKLLSAHLRSEGAQVVEAVEEVIDLATQAKCKLKISHFKIRGIQNYQLADQALAALDRAYQKGLDVFFDVYPYTTSWTVLYTYLPKWAYEGGKKSILKNLKNETSRKSIISYLQSQERDLGTIFIATSETNSSLVGKTLAQIAANQETSVEEALLNVLAATNFQVIVFDRNLSENILETLLRHPLSLVATDGAGYNFAYSSGQSLVHPRCFGGMPKFLTMVRQKKLMDWTSAVKKITSQPAAKLKLYKRGVLTPGNFADLVVWDPETICSRSTYEDPYQKSDGISYTIVNGKVAFSNHEEDLISAGKILRL